MPIAISTSRYEHLQHALAGLQKSGVALVEYSDTNYIPSAFADDIGMYVLIPKLALLLGISIDQAISIFFTCMTFGAGMIGLWGFCMLYKTWPQRIVAGITTYSLINVINAISTDVYSAPPSLVIAVVPWALYFFYNNQGSRTARYLFLCSAGIACATAHYIRAHSHEAPLIFMLALALVSWKATYKEKLRSLLPFTAGFAITWYYFHTCLVQYKMFAQHHMPDHAWITIQHPFWHSIYLGLGYLQNKFGISFNDSVGFEKVRSLHPEILTYGESTASSGAFLHYDDRYESFLKQEVLSIIRQHPLYIRELIFAKLGVIAFYFLRYANIGLVALWYAPISWQLFVAFTGALGWAALPSILVVPSPAYLLSFIAFAAVIQIVCINHFLESDAYKHHLLSITKLLRRRDGVPSPDTTSEG